MPPIRSERRRFLDRSKNPFFDHAEAEYFLARREGEVVGRITAQVDERWDTYKGGGDGWFGFLEGICAPIDEQEFNRRVRDDAAGIQR